MKILTITNGFTKMRDAVLELRANEIHTAMSGNPNFPTPVPALTVLSDAITAFSTALYECRDGDRLKVAIKNQKREELIAVLHLLADFVLFKSAGNSVVALSSGYSIGKQPAPAPPITTPQNYRLKPGPNPGELLNRIARVKGAISYSYQYATDAMMAQDNWKSIPCSRTTCVLQNLQTGTKYNCRVVAIGPREQLMYSDILTRVVA